MSDASGKGPPKSILLATDLSPRCDRAVDRAVSLSQQWQAKLAILHVIEDLRVAGSDEVAPSWRRPPDPVSVVTRRLMADIGPLVERADVIVDDGDTTEVIVRHAEQRDCDLIITGVARDELFGRFTLGNTVDRLLRRSRTPLLIVKNRARQPYHHIAVATDFSDPSRHALEAAVRFFPDKTLTIFHAYHPPMSGLLDDSAAFRAQCRTVAEGEYTAFLESLQSGAAIKQRTRSFIEFGRPADILREGVRDMNIDLVVLGTQGRGAIAEALIGSVAKEIMAEVPCDALLIRSPHPPAAAS